MGKLSDALNRLIDEKVPKDGERGPVLERVASAGGIKPSTLDQILSGEIKCPPLERLRGFARALGTSLKSLQTAAESDGCSYNASASNSVKAMSCGTHKLESLSLGCEVTIEAAAGDDTASLPKFTMVAYSGGLLKTDFGPPAVISLAGMTIPSQQRPVRFNHSSYDGVGHTERIAIVNGRLIAEGVVSRDTPAAQEVVASGRNGFPWQASVGVSVQEFEFINDGATVIVNGRKFKGPLRVALKTTLNEISFVDLGADPKTRARIAAQHEETQAMADEPTTETTAPTTPAPAAPAPATPAPVTPAPVTPAEPTPATPVVPAPIEASEPYNYEIAAQQAKAAESQRCQKIHELTASAISQRPSHADEINTLALSAIKASWEPDKFELEAMRMGRNHSGVGGPRRQSDSMDGSVIEAALCVAGGLDSKALDAQFDDKTLDAARKQYRHGLGLTETVLLFAQANGFTGRVRSDLKGLLQHGFADIEAAGGSTMSLPGILSNVANKFTAQGFESVESTWREIAAIRSVRDFKQISSYALTGGFVYEELAPGGELKHATVGEAAYSNQARTYGRMFGIDRRQLIDDDLDALTGVPRRLGRGGALKLNEVFWTAFLNNATFFVAGNNNYAEGAGTAFGIDSLTQAETLFLNQTDPDGHPLAVSPTILLVPNALSTPAAQIMKSTELRDPSSTKKTAVSNPHAGKFRAVRSSYLGNPKFAGSSTLAWYLLADPNDMPVIEVAFLNGQQSPTVESADADFNTLGIQMRGYHDFGVALQEPRGGVKLKGEA